MGQSRIIRSAFKKIGIFIKPNDWALRESVEKLIQILQKYRLTYYLKPTSAKFLGLDLKSQGIKNHLQDQAEIFKSIDLLIAIGGDGTLLNAARGLARQARPAPILGINRGKLGFLADLLPEQLDHFLPKILIGESCQEKRHLIRSTIIRDQKIFAQELALNDSVLYTGDVSRLINFEVWINNLFVLKQRADGMIICTPTGSTAYALSAGGPIINPNLHAFALVPMLPHTLSSRPLVVPSSSTIELILGENPGIHPKLSCDGQVHFDLLPGDKIVIEKHPKLLTVLHPKNHDYYQTLRDKLGWHNREV